MPKAGSAGAQVLDRIGKRRHPQPSRKTCLSELQALGDFGAAASTTLDRLLRAEGVSAVASGRSFGGFRSQESLDASPAQAKLAALRDRIASKRKFGDADSHFRGD